MYASAHEMDLGRKWQIFSSNRIPGDGPDIRIASLAPHLFLEVRHGSCLLPFNLFMGSGSDRHTLNLAAVRI
jgi:hypothetical protein